MNNFLSELFNHNRYKTIAALVCGFLLFYCLGCPVRCNSILHEGQKVTRPQLQLEIDEFYSRAVVEANSLDKQEQLRDYLFAQAVNVASTGAFNWLGLLTGLGSIVGVGAVADNVRYRIKFPCSKQL